MNKAPLYLGLASMSLLLLVLLSLSLLCFTERGTQYLLRNVVDRVDGLSMSAGTGDLGSYINLSNVRYESDNTDIHLGSLRIEPSLLSLLVGQVKIKSLRANTLDIAIYRTASGESGTGSVVMPFALIVQRAEVNHLTVQSEGERLIQIDRIDTSIRWQDEGFTALIHEIAAKSVAVTGEVDLVTSYPFEFNGKYESLRLMDWSASGSFRGSVARITSHSSLRLPEPVDIQGTIELGNEPELNLSIRSPVLKIDDTEVENISLIVEGKLKNPAFSGSASISNPFAGAISVQAEGHGNADILIIDRLLLEGRSGHVYTSGSYRLADGELDASFQGDLNGLPILGQANLRGRTVEELNGSFKVAQSDNRLELSADQGLISLEASAGNLSSVIADLGGQINVTGEISLLDSTYQMTAVMEEMEYRRITSNRSVLKVTGEFTNALTVEIETEQLATDDTLLGRLTATYSGSLDTGSLRLGWQHSQQSAEVYGTVVRKDDALSLNIDEALVQLAAGEWRLRNDAKINLERQTITSSDHCWAGPWSFCLSNLLASPGGGNATVVSDAFDLPGIAVDDFLATVSWESVDAARLIAHGRIRTLDQITDINVLATGNFDQVQLEDIRFENSNGKVVATGFYKPTPGQLDLDIHGEYLNQPLNGQLLLTNMDFDRLDGEARMAIGQDFSARATASQGQIDLLASTDDLSTLVTAAKGPYALNIQLSIPERRYALHGAGERFDLGDFTADNMELNMAGDADEITNLDFTVDHILNKDVSLGRFVLAARGHSSALVVDVSMTGLQNALNLSSRSSYQNGTLSGRFNKGKLTLGDQEWQLDQPAGYQLSVDRSSVDPHCWRHEKASLCIPVAEYMNRQAKIQGHLNNAPIIIANIASAPDVHLVGTVDAELEAGSTLVDERPRITGSLGIELNGLKIMYFEDELASWNVKTRATINDALVNVETRGISDSESHFALNATVPDLGKPGAYKLEGSLNSNNLGVFSAILPQFDNARGGLNASAALDTTGHEPVGNISLHLSEDSSVSVPLVGVTLDNLQLKVDGDANVIRVSTSAQSGAGQFSVNGRITDPLLQHRSLDLALNADNFSVADRADLSLIGSTDTTVQYQGTGHAKVVGHLTVNDGHVDEAALKFNRGRSVSPDVVVVSREPEQALLSRLELGLEVVVERLSLDLYGLKGQAQGALTITQQTGGPRRATGVMNLVDGRFTRYGQTLNVDRGRLMFNGSLYNPVVDVVSSREIESPTGMIKVSLLLTGPVSDIRSSIVSSPAMSEAQALSYLVLGRSLQNSSGTDGESLAGAALALGLKRAIPITEDIRSALGLSELTITSGIDSTKVVAGKQLSPVLYAEYSYDMLGHIGGILVTYQISDRLSLESHSGESNSMQLIYKLE